MNQHNDKVSVALLAQLVEHYTGHGFKSRTDLNFRPSLHYCLSSFYYCEDYFITASVVFIIAKIILYSILNLQVTYTAISCSRHTIYGK